MRHESRARRFQSARHAARVSDQQGRSLSKGLDGGGSVGSRRTPDVAAGTRQEIDGTEAGLMGRGANPAETMPPIMQYFDEQKRRGGWLIVADPRTTLTARMADLHLQLAPGTDAALANGLLHIATARGLIDSDYIERRTTGYEAARR